MAGTWLHENGRGASRWLNAFLGGDGAVTFSAGSYDLVMQAEARGKRSIWGAARVSFVDGLPGNRKGHCAEAWRFFVDHGLLTDPWHPTRIRAVEPPSIAPPPPKGA
jgi:hypothetical protein